MSDGRAELGDEDAHTTTCDGCGTADCDNWRWSCFHAVTLCASCADYWQENDGQLPDFEQKKLVTDGGHEQHTEDVPQCAHSLGHHWVSGRVEETENGIAIVSRQCRNCGYEQQIPEEKQMEMVRADG